MDWRKALQQKIIVSRASDALQRYLLTQIPEYRVPPNLAAWQRNAPGLRRRALAEVYLRGYPRAIVAARPRVVWGETLQPHAAYTIRKFRFECYPDYWVPALLYEPVSARRRGARVPAVLNPDGHHAGGKSCDYKQARCANLARRGMLALNFEFLGMGELQADNQHNNQAHLNLTGLAGVGLFTLAMKRALDILLAHPAADPRRVAMTGLSGGGWQTIVLSALDPRITLSVPVAGYTAMRSRVVQPCDRGDLEQAPPDLLTVLDYQDMTALLAPRPTLLILNEKDDCCFQTVNTRPIIYDAVKPVYRALGAEDVFETYSNLDPGTHNYGADNRRQLYRFLDRHFGLNTPACDIHEPGEIFPESQLRVGLPDEQETMLSIAYRRAQRLAAGRSAPRTPVQRRALRAALTRVIRLPKYAVRAERLSGGSAGGTMVDLYRLKIGPWTVPLSAQVKPGAGQSVRLILGDGGRAEVGTASLPGGDIFAADILGTGENRMDSGLAMILETIGQRVLGVQVAQVLSLSEFVLARTGVARITLEGNGYGSAFVALVAAALRPERFCRLTVTWETMTLRYLMQWPLSYDRAPSLFCFGLLEVADVPDLLALLEGVEFDARGRCVPVDASRGGGG